MFLGVLITPFAGQMALATCSAALFTDTIGTFYVTSSALYNKADHETDGIDELHATQRRLLDHSSYGPKLLVPFVLLLAADFAGQSGTVRMTDSSSTCAIAYITNPLCRSVCDRNANTLNKTMRGRSLL